MKVPTGGSRWTSSSHSSPTTPKTALRSGTMKVPTVPNKNQECTERCCSNASQTPSGTSPNFSAASQGGFLPGVGKNARRGEEKNIPSPSNLAGRRLESEYRLMERAICVYPNDVAIFNGFSRSSGQKMYAIKMYPGWAGEGSEGKRQRVRHEAQIGLDLPHHPHLVNTVDFFETPSYLAIVMDFWSGGTLLDYLLRQGPLSERQSVHIVVQLLQALEHLHANQVMHRDVKPENIFLFQSPSEERSDESLDKRSESGTPSSHSSLGTNKRSDGEVLVKVGLGDLSLSTSKIPNSDYVGSPQYSSPEMAMIALRKNFRNLGKPLYNEKCDIWSLGIVAFVLLTQLLPFDGNTAEEVFTSVLQNMLPFDKGPRMSPNAKDFILSLTKSNPGSRPSAKEALRHPWIRNMQS